MDEAKKTGIQMRMTTHEVAFVGLSVALMAVSAWVSIPFVLVPFTLQTFVMVFVLLAFKPRACIVAIVSYLVLGALGVPVFSSMRGGIGILAGPSGGFLWGFLIGAVLSLVVLNVAYTLKRSRKRDRTFGVELFVALFFLIISYVCGWAQLCVVASLQPTAAFVSGVAPFLLVEPFKLVAAVLTARAVKRALPKSR